MNLRAIICIILILSCTIFIYTIPHGTLNRSDPTEIQSASDWIATNSPEATVKSGLYSQTYIPLGNNLRPSFILESDYKSIITGERIGRDTYLLLSSTEMEYPIRTTAWITYKPINCYQEYQGQLNTKIYDGGDRSVMDMSTNGANINIPSEYDCEYK